MRRRVPRQRGPDSGVPKSPSMAARESLAPLSAASGIGRSPPPTPRPSKNGHVLSLAPLRDLADDLRTLTVDSFKERLVARVFRHPFLAPIVAATLVPFVVLAWPAVLHLFGAPTQPADGRAPLRAVLEMTLFGLYLIHVRLSCAPAPRRGEVMTPCVLTYIASCYTYRMRLPSSFCAHSSWPRHRRSPTLTATRAASTWTRRPSTTSC